MKKTLSTRRLPMIFAIEIVGLIFILRLFYLQVVDDSYMLSAESNVLRKITIYPTRGPIFDRNNRLIVYDEAAYDLMVVPRQVKNIDTAEFCSLLGISREAYIEKLTKAKKYSRYKPSIFIQQISKQEYGYIEEKLFKFPGFYVQSRSLREYPMPIAAHILGYIGEVSPGDIKADPYYQMGDYIGKSGIEKSYEPVLRGRKGTRVILVDVFNREQGSYREGRYDTLEVPGQNLYLSMDAELQAYGEKLMVNKTGSIVAIEPSTGEILAFVSSPAYDPNLLVGRIRTENFRKLTGDSLKPLLNRAIMGTYPPGSTFKVLEALVGMQEEVISPQTYFSCYGPANTPIRCTHYHVSPLPLKEAIEQSCNSYFWNVFRVIINNRKYHRTSEAYQHWYDHVTSFGLGHKFNTDIPFELSGNIPTVKYYNRAYGEDRWNTMTIRSLSIGQGEILITPLQLANLGAIIANRGYYYPPHLVRATGENNPGGSQFRNKIYTTVNPSHFDVVVEAMLDVFEGEHGTARWCRLDSIRVGGKTGTAQNPHGKEHSLFVAFGPVENPKIAISVIVENAGYGSTWAAPIASLMIEKYLNRTVKRDMIEQRMLEGNLNASR
jgi:penicillin-binding protein 2